MIGLQQAGVSASHTAIWLSVGQGGVEMSMGYSFLSQEDMKLITQREGEGYFLGERK